MPKISTPTKCEWLQISRASAITLLMKHHLMRLFLIWVCGHSFTARACSAYAPKYSPFLAGNYDWRARGGMLITNPRHLQKTAFLKPGAISAHPATWRSRFASLTITQWGREFPVQGLNEVGLAGVVLNAPGSWPMDSLKPQISELQWLQYQLDQFATVEEIVAHTEELNIAPISGKLQYFFCDARTQCAWIEFSHQGPAVHLLPSSGSIRSVTNSSYADSSLYWQNFVDAGGSSDSLPLSYASLHRFVRANWLAVKQDDVEPNNESKIFDGLSHLASPTLTQWQTIFDSAHVHAQIWARGSDRPKSIQKEDFATSCSSTPDSMMQLLDLENSWTTYDRTVALNLLQSSALHAQGFTPAIMHGMIDHPRSFGCE